MILVSTTLRTPVRSSALALTLLLAPTLALAIDAPGNPRGTEVAQSTVKWEWESVAGAVQYELTLDGRVEGRTSDTQYTAYGVWHGDHSLTVKALSADGQTSRQSRTAKMAVRPAFDSASTNRSSLVGSAPAAGPANEPQSNTSASNESNEALARSDENSLIDPNTLSQPGVGRPGYELVFSDEFNGANLNPNRWNAQLRWDGDWNGERFEYRKINGEHQFYVNPLSDDQEMLSAVLPSYNPFEFNGSRVAIRAIRNPLKTDNERKAHGNLREMVSQQDFLSGALSTHDKFSQKYGYFEARIKIPSHVGTFPAFWLYHQQSRAQGNTQRTEIDIMENLGHAPQYIYNSFHYNTGVSANNAGNHNFLHPQPSGQIYTGTDYTQDFHTYAVEWEPGKISWLIDDQVVSELWNDNVNYEDLYLIINLAMGGNWTNFPTNAGGLGRSADQYFPNAEDLQNFGNPALEIDYVRVYKR